MMAYSPEEGGPVVSGISPREGLPGTKVTIRGENLGSNKTDVLELTIHGQSCLHSLEYFSSKKLTCLTGNAVGPGDIIVTTLSGGVGTSTVTFSGIEPEPLPLLDPMEESDVWMEEDLKPLTIPGYSRRPQSQSPGYGRKVLDPLGISRDEARGSRSRASEENLGDMFPNASGDLLAENFNPVWYLIERHRSTTFQELRLGLHRLEQEVWRSEQAPVDFMRDHLGAFLQCYDTLSDVNELLIRNESESQGGSLTDTVEDLLKESARQAEALFHGVLKIKSRADATRNALMVLQRYRFLFNLPKSIEQNIANGEYELVTNDYDRAKSLFQGTQVKVFQKVLDEVEKKIQKFREDLRKKLQVLPSTLEEQRKIIKYLLELDFEGDPAWDCITNMHQWLLRLLFNCKEEFQTPLRHQQHSSGEHTPLVDSDTTRSSRGHSRNISDISFISNASHGSHGSQTTSTPVPRAPAQEGRATKEWYPGSKDTGRPNRILFVEELTAMISESLPDFWRLGQAYFSGALFQGMEMLSEKQDQLRDNCSRNQVRFESMVLEIVEVYTDMANSSLFLDAYDLIPRHRKERLGEWIPFEDSLMDSSGAWLPQIVRQIRDCIGSLQTLPLLDKAVELSQGLAFNVRTLSADTLFYRAAREIEVLHEREDWRVHGEEGGSITSLPILFENLVVEVLLTLKEIVIENHEGETEMNKAQMLDSSVSHFSSLLEHFANCFDYLAFQQEDDLHEETIKQMARGRRDSNVSDEGEMVSPPTDERLLMIMSNLSYVVSQVVPRLFDCFVSHGYPHCYDVQEGITEQLMELDERVFQKYIDRKSESLMGIIEPGMAAGLFDWEQCGEPDRVRSYIREILLTLVQVHAEVYAVSSQIVWRVLSRLMELLSEEFLRLLRQVENFSFNGSLYAHTELAVLEEIMSPYLNDGSIKHFTLCRELLGTMDEDATLKVHCIVQEFRKRTDLQLRCFRMQESEHDASVHLQRYQSPHYTEPPPLPPRSTGARARGRQPRNLGGGQSYS